MHVDCYLFQQKPFRAELKETAGLLYCGIRSKWLKTTPEEKVRQAMLSFLKTACQDLYPQHLAIRVEYTSLDVALFLQPVWDDFCPALPPLLIIETKQRSIHPVNTAPHEQQITNYLQRTRCPVGILTNCQSLWLYQLQEDRGRPLHDLQDVLDVIRAEYHRAMDRLQEQRIWFEQAKTGCYHSFQKLMNLYGKHANSTVRFAYERNNTPVHVDGFLFRMKGEHTGFKVRNRAISPTQECTAQSFQRLISIISQE
jgi:hypothetical protein